MISRRWLDNALSPQKRGEGPDDGPSRARRAEKVGTLARRVIVVINEVVMIDLDCDFPITNSTQHHDGKI